VLSDVTAKFEDAAKVFAPQKGADPAIVDLLHKRLGHVADLYVKRYGRNPRGLLIGFDDLANTPDAVVLGEGELDSRSFLGKIVGVAARRVHDRPVLAAVGSTALDLAEGSALGLSHIWVASNPSELHDSGKDLGLLIS
jgi:glycerate kinase